MLIRTFSGFFRTLASVGGVLVIIGLGAPVVLLGIIPIFFIYKTIMSYYLASSRELKRLDSTSRAPIFSWFGETLSGLSSIRAYSQTERFSAHNEAYVSVLSSWIAYCLSLFGVTRIGFWIGTTLATCLPSQSTGTLSCFSPLHTLTQR